MCLFIEVHNRRSKDIIRLYLNIYQTEKKKLCPVKRESHIKRCDTMGFLEDGTGELETGFRLLTFKIFSLRRTFSEYSFAFCVV